MNIFSPFICCCRKKEYKYQTQKENQVVYASVMTITPTIVMSTGKKEKKRKEVLYPPPHNSL